MTALPTKLTVERLREALDYDPATGVFRWLIKPNRRIRIGDAVGNVARGYRQVWLDHHKYFAHRLAWFYVHGVWPINQIDHINGRRDDNRLANLREATNAENHQNLHRGTRSSTSPLLGVSFCQRTQRWAAFIESDGRTHFLGRHDTPEKAYDAYLTAKREMHRFWVAGREA